MKLAASVALVLLWSSTAWPTTHCVNPGGTAGCFGTLQAALDVAEKKDLIQIEPGTYPDAAAVPDKAKLTINGSGAGVTILEDTLTIGARAKVFLSGVTVRATALHGIVVGEKARLELSDSEVRDCPSTGIVADVATLTVERSSIRDNGTLGIVSGRKLTLRNSTVSGHVDDGIETRGGTKVLIENSTVSGNLTGVHLKSRNRLTIYGSTIAANQRGLFIESASRMKIANSIVADNTSGVDCESSPTKTVLKSKGYSLIENNLNCALQGDLATTIQGVDPALGVLANNGGPTRTHALLAGSTAIDSGNPKPPGKGIRCRAEDQRGQARNGLCDIGSFEF